jgi:uncharacterized protein YbjT (DUF2867 family)
VVIGGTGLVGSKVVTMLGEHGDEAVAAAPNTGVNTLTGEGLADALAGASVVIDVSNSPSSEDAAVMLFQPIAADDVAEAVCRTALGSPLNGRVEVAGPEQYRMDEFFRQTLAAGNDPREVVTDPHARYFGSELTERSLVPLADAVVSKIRYADWHGHPPTYPVSTTTT